jgi:hypothetical protein
VNDDLGNSWNNSQQAVFAGSGQVGANYQFNWLVVGVEADFELAGKQPQFNQYSVHRWRQFSVVGE